MKSALIGFHFLNNEEKSMKLRAIQIVTLMIFLASVVLLFSAPSSAGVSAGTTLTAYKTTATITLDGSASEAAWSSADALTLTNYGSTYDVTVKALQDGTNIYVYATWTDATVNNTRKGWVYNGTGWENLGGNEDRISF
ncbi:MAG: hypothetical protein ACXAB4_10665, partial [Candidatus Hodarchaeales archaeon]